MYFLYNIATCQSTVGENSLADEGPVISVKRPVRLRTWGDVGKGS